MGFCGWRWPQCITSNTADRRGATPHAEPRFWNAITGQNMTFADSMEIGHKILTFRACVAQIACAFPPTPVCAASLRVPVKYPD
jgi:hypothetical protein